jgi:hypothetical protein
MIEKKLPLPNSVRPGSPKRDDERQFQEKFKIKKIHHLNIFVNNFFWHIFGHIRRFLIFLYYLVNLGQVLRGLKSFSKFSSKKSDAVICLET